MQDWKCALASWPHITEDGSKIEVDLGDGDVITGNLIRTGMITDEGETPYPFSEPNWMVAVPGRRVDFTDVLYWRLV